MIDIVNGMESILPPDDRRIHAEDVYQIYSGREGPKIVLDNVDLRIAKGELVSLVGPSGCGKSTLLRLFLGAEEPTRGNIFLDGEIIDPPNPTRGIVYQQYSLFPSLTVLENLMLGPRLSGSLFGWYRRKAEVHAQAMSYLATAQLEGAAEKYPEELSGGQRQRVAVLQALMMDPKVLLMDEPFGALDPGTRARMQAFLLEQWEKTGTTIVFVTHDLEEAVYLGTRVVVLSQYYTDDRGDGVQRGSRVVCDLQVGDVGTAASSKVKSNPHFGEMVEHVRRFVLKPDHAWHLRQFDLLHPDSFHTPALGELDQ